MRIGLEYGKALQRIENIQGICVGSAAEWAQVIRNTQVLGGGQLGEDNISRNLAMTGLSGVGQAWICRNSGQRRAPCLQPGQQEAG